MASRPQLDDSYRATSLDDLAKSMTEDFKPLDVARVNEAALTMSRLHGEFPWHQHDEDELFLCWKGSVTISLPNDRSVALGPGDLFVVPRGTQHKPRAENVAYVLHLEARFGRLYKNRYGSVSTNNSLRM
jgi:mannose-6-phosphate isomerase-like protein (cupin superfamily)